MTHRFAPAPIRAGARPAKSLQNLIPPDLSPIRDPHEHRRLPSDCCYRVHA
jgi:hypothetical protein